MVSLISYFYSNIVISCFSNIDYGVNGLNDTILRKFLLKKLTRFLRQHFPTAIF